MQNVINKKKIILKQIGRRFLVLSLIIALLFSLCSCAGGNSDGASGTGSVIIQREPEPEALRTANTATALALRQYISARLKTEEFITADLKALPKEELTKMADDLVLAWESADVLSAGAEDLADTALSILDDTAIKQTVTVSQLEEGAASIASASKYFLATAYAANGAKEFDAKTWAENLTQKYDAMKGAQTIKQLANQLGTDAKSAYQQLVLAQEIIHSDATNDAAYWDSLTKIAQATKTVCKVSLYVAAAVQTGGGSLSALAGSSMTLGQAGAAVVGGADCIVDVASTGSNIILGENHQVTVGFDDVKNTLAPVSAVIGLATLNSAEVGEQISYVGDTLVDWFYEGKIIGVKVAATDGGSILNAQPISIPEAGEAAVKSALEAAEFILPGTNVKTIPELIGDYELSPEDSVLKLKKLISQMEEIIEKAAQLKNESGSKNADEDSRIPEIEALAGTYTGTMTMSQIEVIYDSEYKDAQGNISEVYRNDGNNEFGDWEGQPFDITVEFVSEGNHLRAVDDELGSYFDFIYDPATGMLTSSKTYTHGKVVAEGKVSLTEGLIRIRIDVKETYENSQVPDGINTTVLELTKSE